MIIDKIRKRFKKEEPKRYAIKYGCITSPLATEDEHPYSCEMIVESYWSRENQSIDNLWTVVESIGDGKFLDLVTGEIYTIQQLNTSILDTVTPSYEGQALQQQEELLTYPLSLESEELKSSAHTSPKPILLPLTTEVKKQIMEETMPRQEEIKECLQSLKKTYIEHIKDFYKKINETKMIQLQAEAEKENERRNKELEEQQKARERQEQIRLQQEAREKFRREIDPKFEEMFPTKSSIKKKIKKR